jgi:hypothetical protein
MLLAFATDLEARPMNPNDLPPNEPLAEVGTVRRVRRGRRNLAAFDQLPVTRKVHDLAEADKPCPCRGKTREKIGQEVSWQVEFIPGRFERIEHVRVKYACTHCEQNAANPQITLADKPVQPIDKGMAGPVETEPYPIRCGGPDSLIFLKRASNHVYNGILWLRKRTRNQSGHLLRF